MSSISQIKNKQRVLDHGEVFTATREVNAMLDLVKEETQRIDSRFLEPACGTGNFLAEILSRKLEVIHSRYKDSQHEYELYGLIAVSSLYGIDILEDNVDECRVRLLKLFTTHYQKYFKTYNVDYLRSIKFILDCNILWGDALTLKTVDNDEPITFAEWSIVSGNMVKRRDFTMANLLAYQPMEGATLFSDLGEEAFIPKPTREFPLIKFMELYKLS